MVCKCFVLIYEVGVAKELISSLSRSFSKELSAMRLESDNHLKRSFCFLPDFAEGILAKEV